MRLRPALAIAAPLLLFLGLFQNFSYVPPALEPNLPSLSEEKILFEGVTPPHPGLVPLILPQPRRLFFAPTNRLQIRLESLQSLDRPGPLQLFIEDKSSGQILPLPVEADPTQPFELTSEQLEDYLKTLQKTFANPSFSTHPQDYGLNSILVDARTIRSVTIRRLRE